MLIIRSMGSSGRMSPCSIQRLMHSTAWAGGSSWASGPRAEHHLIREDARAQGLLEREDANSAMAASRIASITSVRVRSIFGWPFCATESFLGWSIGRLSARHSGAWGHVVRCLTCHVCAVPEADVGGVCTMPVLVTMRWMPPTKLAKRMESFLAGNADSAFALPFLQSAWSPSAIVPRPCAVSTGRRTRTEQTTFSPRPRLRTTPAAPVPAAEARRSARRPCPRDARTAARPPATPCRPDADRRR
ncbi:hypothetical protein AWB83_01243 [Caballeronia ptereochthonis]|uniref:Uncharacterized protein n=1 Tax=Caballeronia ptereochthonis TaxID=1777144 RepID=A0A158A224_9BURK|nr:hypothetical protein AWB83_01243 [Caballeronia ptereochthonis]